MEHPFFSLKVRRKCFPEPTYYMKNSHKGVRTKTEPSVQHAAHECARWSSDCSTMQCDTVSGECPDN